MSVDQSLAELSNVLLYSAMAVYTGAMGAFAVDLSGAGRAVAVSTALPTAVPAGVPADVPGRAATETGLTANNERGPGAMPRSRRAASIGVSLTVLAFALHAGASLLRGLSVSRVPWGNMFEFATTGAAVVTGVFLLILLRPTYGRDLRYLGVFVVGPVLLTLGLAVAVLYTEAAQLVPALQSYWLVVHVSVAFISCALFTIAFSASILQLVQGRRERAAALGRAPTRGRFMAAVPDSVELERSAYQLNAVAFVLWTFTLIAGAIWAEVAWGRYWGWDPKEVWTFVIWVVYAGYLHARATRGWDGRRATYLALAGYGCILFNFLVVNIVFVGRHSYAGVG